MTSDERRRIAAIEDLHTAAAHAGSAVGELCFAAEALSEAQREEVWQAADRLFKTAQKIMGALTTAAQGEEAQAIGAV